MTSNNADIQPLSSNTALVSIIIPAYNTGEYIYRAIESSMRQTYMNIEIIIIDDGSTDNTLEVAKSYEAKDERIKVFHQGNAGVSAAKNYGIREAKGEYIIFLDSDDWFEDNAVEVLLDYSNKYPDHLILGNCSSVWPLPEKGEFHKVPWKLTPEPEFVTYKDIFSYKHPIPLGLQANIISLLQKE